MKRFICFAIVLLPQFVFCQIKEEYSDGNFSTNPKWTGDTSAFIINSSFQLQSQGPTASSSIYLSTTSARLKNTMWEFWVHLPFNPSTTNYAKIYLSSDNSNLKGVLNGYYIKVGGESGVVDGIDLYRQNGASSTKIIDGISGHAGKSTNKLRIKVQRDAIGNWLLFSDTLGGYNFMEEGKVLDSTHKESAFIGIVYQHSSTRRNQFYFDDFIIQQAPLTAESAYAVNDSVLEIKFNNDLNTFIANDIYHYSLETLGHPSKVEFSSASSVLLTYPKKIPKAVYKIELNGLKDLNENLLATQTLSFHFIAPLKYGDLLITEIYADPTPSYGLPEEEFIELYNMTDDSINLEGFKYSDASSTTILHNYIIGPREYLILTSSDGKNNYEVLGKTLPVSPWPSLNNSEDNLTLKDNKNNVLFNISYSSKWHQSQDKSEGGWSLEMLNPDEICKGQTNWKSSVSETGGTPGKMNSVHSTTADKEGPSPISWSLDESNSIYITFNENINAESFVNKFQYGGIPIQLLERIDDKKIKLQWGIPFPENIEIAIQFKEIRDCLGNSSSGEVRLIRPGKADSLDILINEILFNPVPGGIDFVEIYNLSGDIIDLKKLSIASIKENGSVLSVPITRESTYIYPQNYKVICSAKEILQSKYPLTPPETIIEVHNFPSYNDDKGIVALFDSEGKTIDYFSYKESYHSGILKDKEGVSLERVSFVASSNYVGNWQSASGMVGYATPGIENSMHHENTSEKPIDIQPKVITPNGDLDKDQAYIHFTFGKVGNYCTIKIFNSAGAIVRNLAENIPAGEQGFFIWDGLDNAGRIVETGIYILFLEYFNESGSNGKSKQTIVVYSDK